MGKKISIIIMKQFFLERGCELLEKNVANSTCKINYRCKCGKDSVTTWNRFQSGHFCNNCYGRTKITYKFLVKKFKEENCELLEEKYLGYSVPMRYKCKCGRESKISWDNFRKGHRCRGCMSDAMKGENSLFWNPDRVLVELNEKVRKKYYHAIRKILKKTNIEKTDSYSAILGFSSSDLKLHLESFPNWEKIKLGKWSVDHIFPIKAFLEHGIFDPKIINCLDNLQPMLLLENVSKGDTYDKIQFKNWLKTKGISSSSF